MARDTGPDELLVGVLALRGRVEAHLVARTPFGRLRPGGRRAVEDDDDLGLPHEVGGDPAGAAGATWAGCIAGAVEKLTFGLPAARLRVGVAVDGEVEGARARVGERAWCEDLPGEVGRVLRTRGIELAHPGALVALELEAAWALGDAASALGPAGNDEPALVLVWSDAVRWFLVSASSRGAGPRAVCLGGRLARDATSGGSGPPPRRPVEPDEVAGLARDAAALLDGPARGAGRIVLTGAAVQGVGAARRPVTRSGGRSSDDLWLPFRAVLPPRIPPGDDARSTAADRVWISTERSAPALGAAAAALAAPAPEERP